MPLVPRVTGVTDRSHTSLCADVSFMQKRDVCVTLLLITFQYPVDLVINSASIIFLYDRQEIDSSIGNDHSVEAK